VRDAEANKEDDKKFHELVSTRNKADQLVHATRAAIKEHGGKVPDQIGAIESALSDLEKVMKGEDKDAIESRITALEQTAQSLAAAAAAGAGGGGDAGAQAGGGSKAKDDVVDAEFTEVKDK
jgi:molecular chaperone DnaK